MSAKPKKVVKIVLWTLAGIVGFVLLALLTIPLWIGPVGTSVANSVVPELTGTAFNLGEFALNPYSGRVHLGKIVLQNPADETSESEPNALTLESVDVLMDTTSLLSDTIVIHDLTVKGLYLYGNASLANLFKIIDHVKAQGSEEEKEEGGKKVVIEKLTIADAKVKYSLLPALPLPTITLEGIGKPEEPATEEAAWTKVGKAVSDASVKAIKASNALVGVTLEKAISLGSSAKEALGSSLEALGNLGGSVVDGASDAVGKGVDALKGLNPFGK